MNSELSKASALYDQAAGIHALALEEFSKQEALYTYRKDALAVLQAISLECQSKCQTKISDVVTRCLHAVFPDAKYTFKLMFEEKRNQTEARCVLLDAQGNEYDPVEATGGGVMDVVSFGLRIACLMLQRPVPRKTLVLDEPWKFLSKQYRGNMMSLVESLATELGIQFILVTHVPDFVRGNVIEV